METATPRRRQLGYRDACRWIALNDNAGQDDPADPQWFGNPEGLTNEIAAYTTTLLVADLYDRDPVDVAKQVLRIRMALAKANLL